MNRNQVDMAQSNSAEMGVAGNSSVSCKYAGEEYGEGAVIDAGGTKIQCQPVEGRGIWVIVSEPKA